MNKDTIPAGAPKTASGSSPDIPVAVATMPIDAQQRNLALGAVVLLIIVAAIGLILLLTTLALIGLGLVTGPSS